MWFKARVPLLTNWKPLSPCALGQSAFHICLLIKEYKLRMGGQMTQKALQAAYSSSLQPRIGSESPQQLHEAKAIHQAGTFVKSWP